MAKIRKSGEGASLETFLLAIRLLHKFHRYDGKYTKNISTFVNSNKRFNP